jgi:arylsulfatase
MVYDFGETVSKHYHGEFPFTGTVHSVKVDLSGDLIVDDEAAVRQLMVQQ